MPAEPLITWPDPLMEYLGFIGWYFALGAIGFWSFVLRRTFSPVPAAATPERAAYDRAGARAAMIGLLGALVGALLLWLALPEQAARRHVGVAQLLLGGGQPTVGAALALLAIVGFLVAFPRRGAGFALAAIGVVGRLLLPAFFGQWARLANPVHLLGGGFWIGTLFVMVVAGLFAILRSGLAPDRRGALAATMVHAFSPLALVSFAVLGISGLITAWKHLHVLSALWTTPYGVTLIIKLFVVLGVLLLGAWNWRRQRPRLGSEAAAVGLRRSATAELVVAALVLCVTAILVSLPSPRPPGPPPAAAPGAHAD